jgi:hypothetical protein
MVQVPDNADESMALLCARVRRIDAGARATLSHRLGPVIHEQNAWMLRLCDDASEPGETFSITKVMVVVGYWEHETLRAGNRIVLPTEQRFTLKLEVVEDLATLPVHTYRESVARAISRQRPGFERLLVVGDVQLTLIAGPVPLPRPLRFEPVWVEPESPPDPDAVLHEEIFGEPLPKRNDLGLPGD